MRLTAWASNNVGVLLTIGLALLAGYGGYLHMGRDVRDAAQDIAALQRRLDGYDALNLAYRITASEEALKATNQRVDVGISNISERLAEINQALGGLSTQVAVLGQRIESQTPQRRSDVRPSAPSR